MQEARKSDDKERMLSERVTEGETGQNDLPSDAEGRARLDIRTLPSIDSVFEGDA